MVDNLTKIQRSYCMSKIKCKNTQPEVIYKKNNKQIISHPAVYGKPDFIDYKNKAVIFIDGCFWHKCQKHYKEPKSNKRYWIPKIKKNIMRDQEINMVYKSNGWKVIRIWEHELRKK